MSMSTSTSMRVWRQVMFNYKGRGRFWRHDCGEIVDELTKQVLGWALLSRTSIYKDSFSINNHDLQLILKEDSKIDYVCFRDRDGIQYAVELNILKKILEGCKVMDGPYGPFHLVTKYSLGLDKPL
jgi:hypothetical protein